MGRSAVLDRHETDNIVWLNDSRMRRLHEIIDTKSLLRGEFTLSSGRPSKYLFQLRQTTLHSEGALLIAELIVDFMRQHKLRCLGGLVQGAVPIVSSVAPVSFQKGYPIDVFFVRKEAKLHGAKERIDGYMSATEEVLLVDDVTTTGKSMLDAITAMKEAGHDRQVTKALSIVDREEGATEFLEPHGIELFSFFKKSDFAI
jgi:orotate phosphoribosyltransferase